MFRVENNVPNVYENESRDFQLLSRVFDVALCDSRSYIDRLIRIIDTEYCSTNLIKFLQTRLGFLTLGNYSDESIRGILLGFSDILKYKGSRKAIKEAVNLFLKLNHIKTKVYIYINNEGIGNSYYIDIGIKYNKLDTSILDELFRYILPTGYLIEYTFFDTEITLGPGDLALNNYIVGNIVFVSNDINSMIRSNQASSETYTGRLLGAIGETQISRYNETSSNNIYISNISLATGPDEATVIASGYHLNYMWQSYSNLQWINEDITSQAVDIYSYPQLLGKLIRCKLIDGYGNVAYTEEYQVPDSL